MKYVSIVGYHGKKYDNGQRAPSKVYGIVLSERENIVYKEFLVQRLDTGETAWVSENLCFEEKPWNYMEIEEKKEVLERKISDYKKCISEKIRVGTRKPITTEHQYNKLVEGLAKLEAQLRDLCDKSFE